MGPISSTQHLKNNEVIEFAKASSLTHNLIDILHKYYLHYAASVEDDGVIDY